MKTAIFILCAVPGLVQAADFSDYENLLRESITIRAELAEAMEGITDSASARAALPRVKELMEQYAETTARIRAVPQPDEAAKMALERGMREEFAPVRAKMTAQILRLYKQDFFEVEELRQTLSPLVSIQPAPPQLQGR